MCNDIICFYCQETISGKTIEYINHSHPKLLTYNLLTSTSEEFEIGFVQDQREKDSQIKGEHQAAQGSCV